MRLSELTEVRSDDEAWDDDEEYDELLVSQSITDYFIRRGYKWLGEGREQVALLSPRDTVVKILGHGDPKRQSIVKMYVSYFLQHQNNPYYPQIYSTNDFTVGNETYFIYEMEYLEYVANEEEALEYLEDLMSSLPRGEVSLAAYLKNKQRPASLPADEIAGLIQATKQLEAAIGGHAPLDLSMIENLRRRPDGHIVIMDPYSL